MRLSDARAIAGCPILDEHSENRLGYATIALNSSWRRTSEPNASKAIGNGQACLGDNAVNDLFSAIVVQRVQGVVPAREFATKELGLVPCGVFLVPGMEGLQKKFALRYQPIDGFCILH
jgi:hypothetical protein